MRQFSLLLLTISLVCAVAARGAAETPAYTTVLLNTAQPVAIDGDLSDWDGIEAPVRTLDAWRWMPTGDKEDPFGKARYHGPEDLSARFRAFADGDCLYLAVEVTDDLVVFERETFGETWWDDAVQVYLEDGSLLDITRNRDGDVVLEGRLSLNGLRMRTPYLWDAVGVRAGLQEQQGGYSVEVQIPRDVLGLPAFQVDTKIGLNVSVSDHDDAGRRDNARVWCADEGAQGPRLPSASGRIVLGSEQRAPSGSQISARPSSPLATKVRQGEQGGLVVTLTDRALDRQITFDDLRKSTIATVQQRLAGIKAKDPGSRDVIWSAGALFALTVRQGQCIQAIRALDDLDRAATAPYVSTWAALHRRSLNHSLERLTESALDLDAATAQWEQIRQHAVEKSDDDLQRRSLEALVRLHDRRGNPDRADALRRQAIDYSTGLIQRYPIEELGARAAQTRLGHRLRLGEDAPGAQEIERYLKRIADHPQQAAIVLDDAAVAYRDAGKYELAIATHRRMLETAPDVHAAARAQCGLGSTYLAMQDFSKAIGQFEAVIQVQGDDQAMRSIHRDAYLGLVKAHKELGKLSKIKMYLVSAHALLPPPPPLASRVRDIR